VLVWPDGTRPRPICDTDPPSLCGSGNIFGGKVPARTWFKAMGPLHEGLPVLPLPPTDPRYMDGGGGARLPNVVGQGENTARLTLEQAGFKVNTAQTSSSQAAGTVVSQSPSGSALPGDIVTIFVSDGVTRSTPTRRYTPVPGPTEERPSPNQPVEPVEPPPNAGPTEEPPPEEPPTEEPPPEEPPPNETEPPVEPGP
jgi:membrane peptidoglycan carboxypeptidase